MIEHKVLAQAQYAKCDCCKIVRRVNHRFTILRDTDEAELGNFLTCPGCAVALGESLRNQFDIETEEDDVLEF